MALRDYYAARNEQQAITTLKKDQATSRGIYFIRLTVLCRLMFLEKVESKL